MTSARRWSWRTDLTIDIAGPGGSGPLWVCGGVLDHQLEGPPVDPAGLVHLVNGQLESGEQLPARLDPAGPGQRNESTNLDG
jgi:hypothetical protein